MRISSKSGTKLPPGEAAVGGENSLFKQYLWLNPES